MTIKNKISWVCHVLLSLMLIGCGSSGDSELNHYINEIKTRPTKPIEPLPKFTPLPKFIYPEVDNRRSPFKPRVVAQTDTFSPNVKRPKQPLEAFPLDALKFVGTLTQGPTIWALIKQPNGLVSRAKPGDYMGQNYGQIMLIKAKKITIDEAMQVEGKWEKRHIIINLSMPD
jgi:type IV pilus assembly protein PilP